MLRKLVTSGGRIKKQQTIHKGRKARVKKDEARLSEGGGSACRESESGKVATGAVAGTQIFRGDQVAHNHQKDQGNPIRLEINGQKSQKRPLQQIDGMNFLLKLASL